MTRDYIGYRLYYSIMRLDLIITHNCPGKSFQFTWNWISIQSKMIYLLLFRQKQQNHRGRELVQTTSVLRVFGVSGVLISLYRCGRRCRAIASAPRGFFIPCRLWFFYTLPVVQARTCAAPDSGGLTAAG